MAVGREIDYEKGDKGTFGGDRNVLYLDWGDSYMGGYKFVKTQRNVHLKWVHFILCKQYLNKVHVQKTEWQYFLINK